MLDDGGVAVALQVRYGSSGLDTWGGESPQMKYSNAFKAKMVQKMTGPNGKSAGALAKEVGIGQPTLSRWLREAAAPVQA